MRAYTNHVCSATSWGVPQRADKRLGAAFLAYQEPTDEELLAEPGRPWPADVAASNDGARGARRDPRAGVHLTRRGRLVVILLLTLLLVTAFGAGRASAESAPAGRPRTALVQPGDTLWSISSRVAGEADVRATVQQIMARNGATAQTLEPGEVLLIPGG